MHTKIGFELQGLRELVATSQTVVMEPGGSFQASPKPEVVRAEVDSIKHRLLEKALAIQGEDVLKRYVRLHQYALVSLMDEAFEQRKGAADGDLLPELRGLLLFLRKQFSDCFDDRAQAPLTEVADAQWSINLELHQIETAFGFSKASVALTDMALEPLKRFVSADPLARFTFNRIRHVEYVLKHLQRITVGAWKAHELERELFQLLLYLNYNSKKSFIQLTDYVRITLEGYEEISEKYKYVSYLLKEANQATVKPGTAYHPLAPTLKAQMVDYLTAELDYIISIGVPQHDFGTQEARFPLKVKFNFSVAQLGCVIRLLTDGGLVKADNLSTLIRLIAHNCETTNAERISPDSLRNKYYEVEDGTRRAVNQKLAELIKSVIGDR